MKRRYRAAAAISAAACLSLAWGCAPSSEPAPIANFDRPTDVAFSCYGDLRITGGSKNPDPNASVIQSAQPITSCQGAQQGNTPPGQENLPGTPSLQAFVLESAKGTVSVLDVKTLTVLDSNPLAPGRNAIPIGTLPVGVATDPSGCFVMSANAGSCDLSLLDVNSALDTSVTPRVIREPVKNSSGQRLLAKPRAIVAEPPGGPADPTIGVKCAARPKSLAYVAYPACHLVAAIDASTGTVVAGIHFADDGSATLTDGNVTCPAECGSGAFPARLPPDGAAAAGPDGGGSDAAIRDGGANGGGPDAGGAIDGGMGDAGGADGGVGPDAGAPPPPLSGAPRPVALFMSKKGGRLYIASENSPRLTIVSLDGKELPQSVQQVRVEGDVGLTKVAVTGPIEMGGSLGRPGGSGGTFQFAYAIATDGTVRVVDVTHMTECDTEVDPRYAHDIRDVALLSCFPVGDPRTPPRRAGARSPGIQLPPLGSYHSTKTGQVGGTPVPLDVSLATLTQAVSGEPEPTTMVGTFAFITASDGSTFVATIDDDNYPDYESSNDPSKVHMSLAMAHQLRDFVSHRGGISQTCATPTPDVSTGEPRLGSSAVTQDIDPTEVAKDKSHLVPNVRNVVCTNYDQNMHPTGDVPVSELSYAAGPASLELTYPDLRSTYDENWQLVWEGPLSLDSGGTNLDGPTVRHGYVDVSGGVVTLEDGTAPFCNMGVEPYDIATLVGCDPSKGDADCETGETCYTHPDSPASISTGMCLPKGEVDMLSGECRDLLITGRQYTVAKTYAGHLVLAERRRVLRTTPIDGCTSDDQCKQMAAYEGRLASSAHPIDYQPDPSAPTYAWKCGQDPSRAKGPDVCMMTCSNASDCEPGWTCSQGGFCVAAPLPPAACVPGVQRYQIDAGDAFTVIGSETGFLHNVIEDPNTGECVQDPNGNPLHIGRIPLRAPPCSGDGLTDVSPNPCQTTVKHTEEYVHYTVKNNTCVAGPVKLRQPSLQAIRFSNPAFTINLVDMTTTGDLQCRGDRNGTAPRFSAVYPGYGINFSVVGGFYPMYVGTSTVFPGRIKPGPYGRMWVMDRGDSSASVGGQVVVFDPTQAPAGFNVVNLQ